MPKSCPKNLRLLSLCVKDESFGTVYTAKLNIWTILPYGYICLYLLDLALAVRTPDIFLRYRNAARDEHTVSGKIPKIIYLLEGSVLARV